MKINLREVQSQAERQARLDEIFSLPQVQAAGRYIIEPHTALDNTDVPEGRTPFVLLAFKVVGVDTSYVWWETQEARNAAEEQVGKYFIDRMYLSERSIGRAVLFCRTAGIEVELDIDEEGNADYWDALEAYTNAIVKAFEEGSIGKLVGIATIDKRVEREFDELTGDFVEVEIEKISTPFNAYRRVVEE